MKAKNLFAIIGAVAVINLLSRFIGFFREVVIGYQFGTSFQADSIITAYTIPNFLYIVAGGAVTTAFISVYSKINDPFERRQYLETFFGWVTVGLTLLTLGFVFFSDLIIRVLFPGLSEETAVLANDLFQVMAPATLFLILSMWLTGILNVNERFSKAAAATLLMNGSFLLIAVIFFPLLGPFAHGYGAVISAALMFLYLFYLNKKAGFFHFRPRLRRSPEIWRTAKMALPILLGGATLQLYFLLHRVFASALEEGMIAALNYTSKLVQMPQTVLMTAVTTVIYPLLAKKVAERADKEITSLYGKGLQMMALAIFPATVFAFFYAEPLVEAIFQYGNFTAESTAIAVPLLQVFVFGMFFHASNVYITRFYYAYEKSIYPVMVSMISVFGINVAINFALISSFGAIGLAWGTSISAACNFVLLVIGVNLVLKWKKKVQWAQAGKNIGKLVILNSVLAIGLLSFSTLVSPENPFVSLISGGVVFLVLTIVMLKVLRFKEWQELQEVVLQKVREK